MNSYVADLIVNSKEDKCKKINSLIKKGIISPDEIIKIIVFNEKFKEFLPNILENIFFTEIGEFININNYLSDILDINYLVNIRNCLVPRLRNYFVFDVSRDEATYYEWVKLSFKIQLDTCIKNLNKKNKELIVRKL